MHAKVKYQTYQKIELTMLLTYASVKSQVKNTS